ncbi:MAG: PIN domain-containing protein, partial [Bryobacteraceae bacterium]
MIVLDANVLLYAYNSDAPHQAAAAEWVERLFRGAEIIALPWITLWAFLRISTNARLWPNPKSPVEAFGLVRQWLSQPGVTILNPG